MSLATRCTACGTVFRVVHDQLKVSEGWVRCGRCDAVFNALEGLLDLDRDTPPDWSASSIAPTFAGGPGGPSRPPPRADEPAMPPQAREAELAPDVDAGPLPEFHGSAYFEPDPQLDKIDAQLTKPKAATQNSTPAKRISERDRLEFPDAQFDSDMLAEEAVDLQFPASAEVPLHERIAITAAQAPHPPRFVKHAQARARWQRPRMRLLLGTLGLMLTAALAAQVVHQFRDTVAAHWPATLPLLAAWCGVASCTVAPPRRIDDIAVESTALARVETADAFKLSVVLRNRGSVAVALPSVDLSLTDANGQLVARRVLSPNDFRAGPAPLRAGGESALQTLLAVAGSRVSGYTVEVFYP